MCLKKQPLLEPINVVVKFFFNGMEGQLNGRKKKFFFLELKAFVHFYQRPIFALVTDTRGFQKSFRNFLDMDLWVVERFETSFFSFLFMFLHLLFCFKLKAIWKLTFSSEPILSEANFMFLFLLQNQKLIFQKVANWHSADLIGRKKILFQHYIFMILLHW